MLYEFVLIFIGVVNVKRLPVSPLKDRAETTSCDKRESAIHPQSVTAVAYINISWVTFNTILCITYQT